MYYYPLNQTYENNLFQNNPNNSPSANILYLPNQSNVQTHYSGLAPVSIYSSSSLPNSLNFSYSSANNPYYPLQTQQALSTPNVNFSTGGNQAFINPSLPTPTNPFGMQPLGNGYLPQPIPSAVPAVPNSMNVISGKRSFSSSFSSSPSHSFAETNAAKILCQLGKTPLSKQDNESMLARTYGHVMCSGCHQRITLASPNPPPLMQCTYCGLLFPVIRRFVHDFCGEGDSDQSLELPFLRGLTNPYDREREINNHLQIVLVGRRCNYSSSLRDIQKILSSLINKVDKMVTKEQKMIDEECRLLVNVLVNRAEQYLNGELHCCCFQPAFPQRHFIQCDICNIWYHTSCVGIDSRKVSSLSSYVCPWCMTDKEIEESDPEEEVECICPYCKRVFPRPCNLSRHLHAKHNIKWNTHRLLHVDVDDYLEKSLPAKQSFRTTQKKELFEGCFVAEAVLDGYEMTVSHYRFLLRKLRSKPSQWWIGREIRIWDYNQKDLRLAKIKSTRPRNELLIQYRNGSTVVVGNLFDPALHIRLLILNGYYELELFHAFPTPQKRDVNSDLALFINSKSM